MSGHDCLSLVAPGRWVNSNQRAALERRLDSLDEAPDGEVEDEVFEAACADIAATVPTTRDVASAIAQMRAGPVYVYLAFFGLSGICKYVKIGMSNHPESRVYGFTTGNPFDFQAIYACKFPTRRAAYAAEQSLLRRMANNSRRGEWLELEEFPIELAQNAADHIGGQDYTFAPCWIKGRKL